MPVPTYADVGHSVTIAGNEQGFATTRLDALLGWARKYSLFAYPFATACCSQEFFAVARDTTWRDSAPKRPAFLRDRPTYFGSWGRSASARRPSSNEFTIK
jgi:hypothetical protein